MSSFVLCSCRLLPLCLLRPSRPLHASGPDEPPEQQRTEAEADRVQEDQLAVSRHERPEQQRRDHDRYRQPLAPPDESARLDRESPDPWNQFLDVHRRLLVSRFVWDNHFTEVDRGAADRSLPGHRRPPESEGRRTPPEQSPNSIRG